VSPATKRDERGAGLILAPIATTLLFYAVPASWQAERWFQFIPQICAYMALACWAKLNPGFLHRLGLAPGECSAKHWPPILIWGTGVGLMLSAINLAVILFVVPYLGYGYSFLANTPHARIPPWLMIPWFVVFIAFMVELNFRGFLLGRLTALGLPPALAILTSAILFACDPFLVTVFRHLHWIAVWDGLIWGALRLRFDSLLIPIVAHAVEVIMLYSVMRAVLS
jgi:hypothetical protein